MNDAELFALTTMFDEGAAVAFNASEEIFFELRERANSLLLRDEVAFELANKLNKQISDSMRTSRKLVDFLECMPRRENPSHG